MELPELSPPTRRPRRRAIRAGAIGLVCLLLASCTNPVDTPRERAGTCQVGVVGDSLTVGAQSEGDLEAKLADQLCTVTSVDAVIGRSTAAGADVVEAWAEAGTVPAILLVELGTNDCSASTFEPSARRILAAAGPTTPVVWVTTWRSGFSDQINAVIEQLQQEDRATGRDRIWLVDGDEWLAAHPEYLVSDGVHLTATGYGAFADLLAGSVGDPSALSVGITRARDAIEAVATEVA